MGKCINCGKDTESIICDICAENKVVLQELCMALMDYITGSGKNPLWDQLAIEAEGQINFRGLALHITEQMDETHRSYYRALCLAGDKDYLPKMRGHG